MNKSEKLTTQAHFFENRLIKKKKHLKKWAKRGGVFCYRVYDKDIPEIPLAVDIYTDFSKDIEQPVPSVVNDGEDNRYAIIYLYKRPYEKTQDEQMLWLKTMTSVAGKVLNVPAKNIFTKIRQKQTGKTQYEKKSANSTVIVSKEGSAFFYINLSDYLDTGLFLDHRLTRINIGKIAQNKTVLNLFCYTGAFSVHAALGGARAVTSVDLSKTYLQWAKNNFILNKISLKNHEFINSDVLEFMQTVNNNHRKQKWDIIICDPPTFSNSKKTKTILDINKDWLNLICECISLLSDNGKIYFSSNSKKLQIDTQAIIEAAFKNRNKTLVIKDITKQSIDEDFKNSKIHRLWEMFFVN
ncbi:MAG: rRNA (guanine-N2)-methyltransferase [Treponema sp.]|nr:MAG: rRNA (guanine-N2)-methyltransferase [Treponema sp.]